MLQGVRVLDMAWIGPGPMCSEILADMGADVIRIREVERGGRREKESSFGQGVVVGARNVRSIKLNLKEPEGKDIFFQLARTADVIQEGFRPGVVKRLGVDYQTVKAVNPRIIYASISGYGQDGPYAQRVGHDINYQAIAGVLSVTGRADGPPVVPGIPLGDFASGSLSGVIHILAALYHRERTGEGAYADVSMTDGLVTINNINIGPYLANRAVPHRGKTITTGMFPYYGVYETKDRKYISIGPLEFWFYERLMTLLGLEEFLGDQMADEARKSEMASRLTETFKSRTRDEWVSFLGEEDVCFAPVLDIDEVVNDEQLLARGALIDVDHPTLGRIRQAGPLQHFEGREFKVRGWNLAHGQYTDEILTELGYSQGAVSDLRARGVVG